MRDVYRALSKKRGPCPICHQLLVLHYDGTPHGKHKCKILGPKPPPAARKRYKPHEKAVCPTCKRLIMKSRLPSHRCQDSSAYGKEYRRSRPGWAASWTAARYALKLKATPKWASKKAIRAIYAEAARLTKETGERHDVDHIVPLVGWTVCGLHVEYNLRILKHSEHVRAPKMWSRKSAQIV